MNMPLLSVCLITYNHEKYIRQAIEGILMQKVDFEWELIIADDCSTDKTREIVLEYKNKHPDFINLIFQEKNVGPAKNWLDLIEAPKSKYIAYFEGDDYWTDCLKLQKQVDFLEKNEEFVISCSNSNIVNFDSSFVKLFNEDEIPEITDVNYILTNKWYIPTLSVVFRNNKIELPKWYYKVLNGDYMLYLLLTTNGGLVHYNNEVRGSYRIHDNGASNIFKKKNTFNYSMLYNNKMFNNYSKGKYYSLIKTNIENYSLNILEQLPFSSKEFWKVIFNLVWFNKTLSRNLLLFFKKRISLKIKLFNK